MLSKMRASLDLGMVMAKEKKSALDDLRGFLVRTRHAKKLTQRDVAKRGGIPPGTVGSIEAGSSSIPSQETMQGLAKGYGVPYSVLDRLARGLPPEPNVAIADLVLIWAEDDPQIRDLLMRAAALPPDRQAAFSAGLAALVAALQVEP